MASSTPQVITCKAAVAWAAGAPLVLEDVEVSPPQPFEIRIKVVSTSLCRSDLSAWESHAIFPHEASGVVEMKVSPHVPLDKICLLSCGVSAGLGAAWNVADVTKGSTVVIFGLGTVGLSVAQGAKLRGASRIIGVDNNTQKCENAKSFGVTEVVDLNSYNEPIAQVIKRITDGGADFCFECVGDTDMITTALQSCCDGWGLTVTLGVPKVKPEMSAHYGLFLTGRTLKGSLFGGWKPKTDLPSLVEKYVNKEIEIDDYITHNLAFDDINKAFNLMKQGNCLRCVIHMPK
ncbi:unnamed protein product [Vicia faba]|uniref:Alcohol dehydrogenase-like C-terminal domain-containing protein n=1 Tax=Vicia faba TaxID=3906 RepID=A0AAV1A2N6_VICFA|nr:unnamed protein product [Vicia faba]